jgi:hypothetical protein
MADSNRKIKVGFVNYRDAEGVGRSAYRGDELDTSNLADGELDRLERAGAFDGSGVTDPVEAGYGDNRSRVGGNPPDETTFTGEPLTDEQIDELKGDDLDEAVRQAGIDPDEGGSLADGSLSADETRAALTAAR